MRKFVLLFLSLVVVLLSGTSVVAQDPVVFSQYLQNPFQFNPAFAASNGHMEANMFYRQQWIGVENAPSSGALNFQTPVGRNVSLGFTALTTSAILLKNSSVMGTFAYRVRLGYYQHLNFGLSGGVAFNNFDLLGVANVNDPAFANIIQRSTYAVNQFGVSYHYKNLDVGFALPKMLDSKPNSESEFQDFKFNPFKSKFASVSYRFNFTHDMQLATVILYRALDNEQQQIEGQVIATWRNTIWVGASYRDGYGVTGFIGFTAKQKYRAGYAYERPTGKLSSATTGTHEFFAGAIIGDRDRELEFYMAKKKKDSLAQVAKLQKNQEQQKQPPVVTAKPDTVQVAQQTPKQDPPKDSVVVTQPVQQAQPKDEPHFTGYYVVVGAFHSQDNAMRQIKDLRARSFFPDIMYLLEKNFYYVYLYHSENHHEASKELAKARVRYPRAWLYAPVHAPDDHKLPEDHPHPK
jgi:type IX secretion system PorP/SprF family membrane protein